MAAKIPTFNWDALDMSTHLRTFKRRMHLYLEDQEIDNLNKAALKLKLALGEEGIKRLDASGLTEDQMTRPGPKYGSG